MVYEVSPKNPIFYVWWVQGVDCATKGGPRVVLMLVYPCGIFTYLCFISMFFTQEAKQV